MGDENPIRTLGDYSKPSHEGYRNTIELPEGNNVVPLRSDTNWLVQNGCSFHGLWSEDPNQHLKDFLKLVDSLDLDVANRERTPVQVKKISSLCEICSGPNDTKYCMENLEQVFIEYASSRTDEAEGKWFTFNLEQNNLGDTYNPSWKIHLNLSQSNLKGLVSNFMLSQDARLPKFEADFKQQQNEMTNKIHIVLKAITDRITGALSSDIVKNPKLNVNSTSLVLSARSYPMEDPQYPSHPPNLINAIKTCSKETHHFQKGQLQTVTEIEIQQPEEPE
ncbi:hypothetical protein Tco_1361465 [Tanacetum coccineum]